MKLISYLSGEGRKAFGVLYNDRVYKLDDCDHFNDCINFLENIKLDDIINKDNEKLSDVNLLSPIPRPNSLRDAYAFRQHVEAGRKSRNLPMIDEYDEFPVYYYSNHNAIFGPGEINVYKNHMEELDFELEVAIVIGKEGRNISIKDADDYIFGYTIMNDFSARKLQKQEMKLSLGPAKGKDFATSLGPYIVTKEELDSFKISSKDGIRYNLDMKAYVNKDLVSIDNFSNITWTFAQIISRISYGTTLFPGDVIGSGTCATGCFLELNQTNKTNRWLQDGDVVELHVDQLGILRNKINKI